MSARAVRIKRRFFVDSQEAKNFIAENSPRAADRFLVDLKKKMAEISRNPEAFGPEKYLPTKRNLYRRAIFKKRWL